MVRRAGGPLVRDQPLVSVATDKAVVAVARHGNVVELRFDAGQRAKVGEVLVVLKTVGASPSTAGSTPADTAAAATAGTSMNSVRVKAAPAVRKLAVELGIDLATVTPTGPGGRVLADDVVDAAAETSSPPAQAANTPAGTGAVAARSAQVTTPQARLGWAAPGSQPLRGIRRRTAELMARAWAEIPHINVSDEMDATRLLAARDSLRSELGPDQPRLTLVPFALLATARALRRHPLVNTSSTMRPPP